MDATLLASLAAFCLAAGLLTITPGMDTALVLRTSTSEGTPSALAASFGICLGCLIWAGMTALGLSALLAASAMAYMVLKWAGAAYLLWLGLKLLLKPRQGFEVADKAEERRGAAGWFARGLLTNLLNPKIGVFYVSFLPQFVPHGVAVGPFIMLLGAIHAALGMAWFAILIGATRPIARAMRKPAVIAALDRLTGVVFVGFGLRLALEHRR